MYIRAVRDTFLHYLSDNLVGIPVHALRYDPDNPGADGIQLNAVNIQFLNVDLDLAGKIQVAVDIVTTNENTAADWMESVWLILGASFMTTVYDYTVPTLPVAQSANLMWARDAIKFRRVSNDNYARYSCVMQLNFRAV